MRIVTGRLRKNQFVQIANGSYAADVGPLGPNTSSFLLYTIDQNALFAPTRITQAIWQTLGGSALHKITKQCNIYTKIKNYN